MDRQDLSHFLHFYNIEDKVNLIHINSSILNEYYRKLAKAIRKS